MGAGLSLAQHLMRCVGGDVGEGGGGGGGLYVPVVLWMLRYSRRQGLNVSMPTRVGVKADLFGHYRKRGISLKGISAEFQVIRGFSQKIPAGLLSYDQIHS